MTADTPGTVSDVSAMFVARMMRRRSTARIAASCASPSSDPWSGTISIPDEEAIDERSALRSLDLARAWQKTQHLSGCSRHHVAHGFDDRVPFAVLDCERVQGARHVHDRRIAEKARDRLDVEGRRHHDDSQIVAREPRLPREREPEVGMNASLVEFVEDDGGEIGEQRILLKARRQNAFRDDQEPRVSSEALFESDLPADFAAERPLAFFCDAPRNGTRSHAARLKQNDRSCIDQRRWNARGLAGAWRRRQHDGPVSLESVANIRDVRVNNQREERFQRPAAVNPRASSKAWMSGSRPRNRR